MYMLALIIPVIGRLLAVILFEAGYKAAVADSNMQLQKAKACQVWWIALGLFAGISGPLAFLINVPLVFAIASSHIDLAGKKCGIVTVKEILRNIPSALRGFVGRVKPFLKS